VVDETDGVVYFFTNIACGVFHDAVTISEYGRTSNDDNVERIRKEAVLA
jgi:hypothetical protein